MKIAIANTYEQTGGAAKAAYRLFRGLQDAGQKVDYLVRTRSGIADPHIVQMGAFNRSMLTVDKLIQRYYVTLNRTSVSNTPFTITYAGVNTTLSKELHDADVINLHWIEKFLSLQSLQQILDLGKPIVWTLHDERPFTGGCHYTSGCEEFKTDCSNCIQLKYDPYKVAKRNLEAKQELFENIDLTIVTPSKWLAETARSSALFGNKRIKVIPNGIDTQVFRPLDKRKCKEEFGIDPSALVLQFGAQDTREKRKGFSSLIEAIHYAMRNERFSKMAREGNIVVLCVGELSSDIEKLPMKSIATGYIDSDAKMVKLYNATDLFILPSLEDNLPNTMIETMACETPVVGYDSGGIGEVVDSSNGRLVPTGESKQLAEVIIEFLFNEKLRLECGNAARQLIEKRYKISHQVEGYLTLFKDLKLSEKKIVKKKSKDFGEYYDPIAGYALRMEARGNNHLFESGQSLTKNEMAFSDYEELMTSIDALCQIHTIKNPLKKVLAYKKFLNIYHNLK